MYKPQVDRASEMLPEVKFGYVDTDEPETKTIQGDTVVLSIPYTLIMKSGEVIIRFEGSMTTRDLTSRIKEHLLTSDKSKVVADEHR